jgi:hypothetical protein
MCLLTEVMRRNTKEEKATENTKKKPDSNPDAATLAALRCRHEKNTRRALQITGLRIGITSAYVTTDLVNS